MRFSDTSDVTIVLTSCGRLDLLKNTLESLDRFNTAPVRSVLITEDSGDDGVYDVLPEGWPAHTTVFVNKEKLGQLASIDLAYASVETTYVFHCEDDWEFYRPGFIEDSLKILEAMPRVLQVWLRNFQYDIWPSYPFHSLGERYVVEGVGCSRLLSSEPDWQGFSFNPGLRRREDYSRLAPFARFSTSPEGESSLSKSYAQMGYFAVVLEGDAVRHTGDGAHVWSCNDERRAKKRNQRKLKRLIGCGVILFLGFLIGFWLGSGA